MIAGLALPDLSKRLLADAEAQRDFILDTRSLHCEVFQTDTTQTPTFALDGLGLKPLSATRHALHQMGAWADIPRKYVDRLAADAPTLLARNLNHWFETTPKARMIRTHIAPEKMNLRAFLSNSYRCIDNADLARIVIPLLMQNGWRIESSQITDDRFYIQAVNDAISAEVVTPSVNGKLQRGDIVSVGLVIQNSEVGSGSLWIRPMVYRLACTNGMIALDQAMRRTHVGRKHQLADSADLDSSYEMFSDKTRELDDAALFAKVTDIINGTTDPAKFATQVAAMSAAAHTQLLAEAPAIIEVTKSKFNLSDGETGAVLDHLARGGDLSLWGLLNAVTRTAQDATSYDRAIELEAIGGQILTADPAIFGEFTVETPRMAPILSGTITTAGLV